MCTAHVEAEDCHFEKKKSSLTNYTCTNHLHIQNESFVFCSAKRQRKPLHPEKNCAALKLFSLSSVMCWVFDECKTGYIFLQRQDPQFHLSFFMKLCRICSY